MKKLSSELDNRAESIGVLFAAAAGSGLGTWPPGAIRARGL